MFNLLIKGFKTYHNQVKLDKKMASIPLSVRVEHLNRVPIVEGKYVDKEGHSWELRENGQWYDRHGITQPLRFNWIIGTFGVTLVEKAEVK